MRIGSDVESQLKILLYSKPFWPMVGGVETYTRLLVQGLAAQGGCEVTVATAAEGPPILPGASLTIIRRPSFRHLWTLILHADVVMLAGPVFIPLLLGLLFRKSVVVEHHGYQACCVNGLLLFDPDRSVCPERYLRGQLTWCVRCNRRSRGLLGSVFAVVATAIRRVLCQWAAANICVSNHVARRVKLARSRVIYHGLETNEDEQIINIGNCRMISDCLPGSNVEALQYSEYGVPVFGYVGRISGEKGLSLLLEAVATLKGQGKRFEVLIIGDGPGREDLEASVREMDLTGWVRLTGSLQGSMLQERLKDIGVVIMPSICEETAGLAAMEQMMRGRLVIAADIGGLGEVVGDAALKFPAGDAQALADRMAQVLDDARIVDEVGAKARQRAQRMFKFDRMIHEHCAVFEEVTGKALRDHAHLKTEGR